MIVRHLREIPGTDRDVQIGPVTSRRLLLARDGTPYSLHDTLLRAPAEIIIWYKHHIESVYCVAGEGELVNTATGEVFPISDGTCYCLNLHDPHILRAFTDLRLICIFTPALVGPEIHDEDGAFPLLFDEATNGVAPTVTTNGVTPSANGAPIPTNEPATSTNGVLPEMRRGRRRRPAGRAIKTAAAATEHTETVA